MEEAFLPPQALQPVLPRFADTVWLLAEAGYWSEANGAASTCREIYTDERVLLGGTARFVANKALGRTKLHHACLVGNMPRALALLDCGRPSFVDSADIKAETGRGDRQLSMMKPLDFAVSGGHAEIARMLVSRGADIATVRLQRLTPGRRLTRSYFRRMRSAAPSGSAAEAKSEAAVKGKELLRELLRLPAVSAGGALKCALR